MSRSWDEEFYRYFLNPDYIGINIMSVFLETKRLILKTADLCDLDMLVALRSDFEVMESTGYGGTQTKEEVREYLDFAISYQEKHRMGFCLVFEKESGSFIGEAGLFHLLFDDTQSEIELGYHLHKKFWGKGYGTELAKTLIQWGFENLSINKLVSTTYPNNVASQKVLTKAGFDCMSKKQLPDGEELFWYEIYKNDSIELVPYDPQWPKMTAQEINVLLRQLLLQIQSILANEFVGMYVGGSLSGNSFNMATSDIDCYIITTKVLSENMVRKIEEMHTQFYSSKLKYAKKIEASYIPQNDLIDFDPQGVRPYFNEGCYYLAHYGNNYLIELFVLREKGISIAGPDIKCLIKEISTQSLKAAIQKNLHEYWATNLIDVSKFKRSDYQVFAILTMCRTLYSLKTGKIASKIDAAQWAMQHLDAKWKNLIELAIAWEPSQEINKLEESQHFVRYVLNKSGDYT